MKSCPVSKVSRFAFNPLAFATCVIALDRLQQISQTSSLSLSPSESTLLLPQLALELPSELQSVLPREAAEASCSETESLAAEAATIAKESPSEADEESSSEAEALATESATIGKESSSEAESASTDVVD